MADVWEFGEERRDDSNYSDGTIVPHLEVDVLLNGKKVGLVEVHMHKRRGRDGLTDTSFGFTGVVYSTPQGGR